MSIIHYLKYILPWGKIPEVERLEVSTEVDSTKSISTSLVATSMIGDDYTFDAFMDDMDTVSGQVDFPGYEEVDIGK